LAVLAQRDEQLDDDADVGGVDLALHRFQVRSSLRDQIERFTALGLEPQIVLWCACVRPGKLSLLRKREERKMSEKTDLHIAVVPLAEQLKKTKDLPDEAALREWLLVFLQVAQ